LVVVPEIFSRGPADFKVKSYYVYILASGNNNALYIGVTNDLIKRVYEHKQKYIKGFSEKYNTHKLVYYEQTEDVNGAIAREKQLKKWNRAWKERLINKENPKWNDLYDIITESQ